MNELPTFWQIFIVVLSTACFAGVVILVVKGKEDADTLDGEIISFLARVRLAPVTKIAYDTLCKQLEKCKKLARRYDEGLDVAEREFANKFGKFLTKE